VASDLPIRAIAPAVCSAVRLGPSRPVAECLALYTGLRHDAVRTMRFDRSTSTTRPCTCRIPGYGIAVSALIDLLDRTVP